MTFFSLAKHDIFLNSKKHDMFSLLQKHDIPIVNSFKKCSKYLTQTTQQNDCCPVHYGPSLQEILKTTHALKLASTIKDLIKPPRTSTNHNSCSFENIRIPSDQYVHRFLPSTNRTRNLLPQYIVT